MPLVYISIFKLCTKGLEADVPLGNEVIEENNAPPSRMAGEEEEEEEQPQPQPSLEDRNEIGFDGEKSVATRNESAAPSKSSAMMETTVVAPLKSVGQAPSVDTPLLIPVESIESTDPAPVETVVNTPSQPALLTATPALTEKVATTPESREKPYEADIEEAGSVVTTTKATNRKCNSDSFVVLCTGNRESEEAPTGQTCKLLREKKEKG